MHRRRFFTLGALMLAAAAGCGRDDAPGPVTGRLSFVTPGARGERWDRIARALSSVVAAEGLAAAAGVGNRPGETVVSLLDSFAATSVPFARQGRLLVAGMSTVTGAEMSGGISLVESATPLARLVGDWVALVVADGSPLRSFEDLAAALRRDPAGPAVGGRDAGGSDHVLYGMIGQCLGVDVRLLDYVGYLDSADALEALHSGRLAALMGPARSFSADIAAGRLRPLAVSAADRIEGIDAPTLLELEIRLEYSDWCGVLGPRRMSEADDEAAVALCDRIDASPRWQALCAAQGWDRFYLSGGDFRQWLTTETRRTRDVLYDLGLLSASDTRCGAACVESH
ncbi:Bug family tripartite tricarboxylate transporter substrate binding protein [Planobispora siamensis]|uniref:C4-dicarboxylate ABC transporter substrate-binding protein n=1 Tax=Planobispora siamensis TaxID=936338 RepID=A0A8J3WJC4_9ACTN|nr:tripartite tricarboxylate transporter substrate-binding protein [Planobispora siamensis]GIH92794.1 C4-dicarboxylate ABC transporter substrate-binding protein [Planobispora siamensis]